MRTVYPFNANWLFRPEKADDRAPDHEFDPVMLPHTNKVLPYHNFDDAEYQFVSTYRKRFTLPEPLNGRRLYLDFEGAMIATTLRINDRVYPEHPGGYTPFSFDITDAVNERGENVITVHLDSTEREDIPPFGYVVDYLTFGGIYREVALRYVEPCHITNIFARPQNVLSDNPSLEVDVMLHNQGEAAAVEVGALFGEAQQISERVAVQMGEGETTTVTLKFESLDEDVALWSLDHPALYNLRVNLYRDDQIVDQFDRRIGFREAEFRDDGFYLNGELVKLIGLNRHQTYPYIGAAAPARLQRKDADIVKYELGCNMVRTSHYPQSRHFINRCDEIGLLVFEEIPGWQHVGDEDWQAISLRDVRVMIESDRNHPSIVLWGVRINESLDNDAFYTRTNALAHELDPTRQTGGVRFFLGSSFLEDVYTFNDFSNSVMEPQDTPHLVTEFNGHMFPTKSFDQEERLVEHALRHARIQDKQLGMTKVTGAIGWCAFDYNTHKEFGSGDRICYHGVMDIFRLPKYAAHFYGSQIDPEQRVVLQAATLWSMGDRSEGGNDPLVIFSNCDEIDVYIGEEHHGRFQPDRETYPNLPHPPFVVKGLGMRWGTAFGDLHVIGYRNDEAVAEQRIAADGQPAGLVLAPDDTTLTADGADMTRLVFKVVDQHGNRLPYANKVVQFELEGPGDLIGDNPFALIGGQAALYVRSHQQPGEIVVRASTPRLEPVEVRLTTVAQPVSESVGSTT